MEKDHRPLKEGLWNVIASHSFRISLVLAACYVAVLGCVLLANVTPFARSYKAGEIAVSTLISRYNFTYFNRAESAGLSRYIESSMPVYYDYSTDHADLFLVRLGKFVDALQLESDRAFHDKLRQLGWQFSEAAWEYIAPNRLLIGRYSNRIITLYNVLTANWFILDQMSGESPSDGVELLSKEGNIRAGRERILMHPLEKDFAFALVASTYPRSDVLFREAIAEILVNAVEPTARLDTKFRAARVDEELSRMRNTKLIRYGDILVRRGETVDQDTVSRLSAYNEYMVKNFASRWWIYFVLSLLLFAFLIYRFYDFESDTFGTTRNVLVSLLFFLMVNVFYFFASFFSEMPFVPAFLNIPFAIAAISLPLLLNNTRVAIILLISYSLFALLYPGLDVVACCDILAISLSTIYTSKILKSRSSFFFAALIVGAIQIVFSVISVFYYRQTLTWSEWGIIGLYSIGNGLISAVVSSGIMPILEFALNIPTRFRLLELTNPTTSELLKRLKADAPGTYNHSLLIGDMCEAVAEAIGVDPLLARAGGYYHDIGKMEIPQYFIENQEGENRHDVIKPSMSVAVIKSHVKTGAELARKYHIPEEVIDFIREHHGTTAISYFYHQALGLFGDENVNIEDYEYPGPKPASKATAMLLIADGVEASVRAYFQNNERFTSRVIQDIIEDIIQKRFDKGQFDDCDLTVHDLRLIGDAFFKFLSGYYHRRIEYKKG
jgi:hypothetical protein